MQTDPRYRLNDNRARSEGRLPRMLAGALAFVTAAALIVAGVTVSLFLVAVVVVLGILIFGYVWWKTREVRRQFRERPPGGRVIDGEVVRDREQ